jgi:hypothetical protein
VSRTWKPAPNYPITSAKIPAPEIVQVTSAAPYVVATQKTIVFGLAQENGPFRKVKFSCPLLHNRNW